MTTLISGLDAKTFEKIKTIHNKDSLEGVNRLSVSALTINKHIFWRFTYFIIGYGLFLYFAYSWTFQYWLIAATAILGYSGFYVFKKINDIKKFPKHFVYFDKFHFIICENGILESYPLWEYQKITFTPTENKEYVYSYFIFKNKTVGFPYPYSLKNRIESFCNAIHRHALISKKLISIKSVDDRLKQDDWTEWGSVDIFESFPERQQFFLPGSPSRISLFLKKVKSSIWAAVIAALIGFLVIPRIIDYNCFKDAKSKNTATSYRTYLKNDKNVLYRTIVQNFIHNIYDSEINEYKSSTARTLATDAFINVLNYLKFNNIYAVRMDFFPKSIIKDLAVNPKYKFMPITPAFTKANNLRRQKDVTVTVNSILGKSFPTDVISVTDSIFKQRLPTFKVSYTYNNLSGSYYYPVDQEHIPDSKRTWYYGIALRWYFQIIIPGKDKPLYSFTLNSKPAPRFTSSSTENINVYDNMALSAFDDLKNEFNRKFFGKTSKIKK